MEIGLPGAGLSYCNVYRMPVGLHGTPEAASIVRLVLEVNAGARKIFPLDVDGPTTLRLESSASEPAEERSDVWLESFERKGSARFRFKLKSHRSSDECDVEMLPSRIIRTHRSPVDVLYLPYLRDLYRVMDRLLAGGSVELPCKLSLPWARG